MTVVASCGHTLSEEEGLGITVFTKGYCKEGKKTIDYKSLCIKCFKYYSENNLVLNTDNEKNTWVNGKRIDVKKIDGVYYITQNDDNGVAKFPVKFTSKKSALEIARIFNRYKLNIRRFELNH